MKKFMNPLVNAGFKRIFGRKMYMREFLNDLLMREHPIRHIWFLDKEIGARFGSGSRCGV